MFMPLIIFLVVLSIGLIVREIIFNRFSYWVKKISPQLDDIIVQATKGPFMVLCLMLSLYFALQFSKLPENVEHIMSKSILVLGIIFVVLALANLLSGLIKFYASRVDSASSVTSLTQNIAKIFVFSIGTLIILNNLGISITPILATLGVGGLAVALALQDTLTNLFAGFHITVAKQIRVGDYIKLETGEEGYVVDINWRSTKIKMLPNNLVLIPNDKLNKAIVTNYYLPDKEMAVLVDLGVHYKSDLEKVERITCEVAKAVMTEVNGGIVYFEPFIRYNAFGDSSIKFTVILRAKEFIDQYLIKHEFIKRLHKRYIEEGINIPYPIRAINYEQEKAV
ncbi:MAG: mechanosensitive ion channel family protein [Candidatus Omnitrophica bacterium]|nr:mechanosensitive ion channel family protein [Candidatus Omnitrophota bacterium]MBU1922934.1 mechanosensitive ion channel family protein [Candidatus Omnitrophota bacterium]